MVPRTPTALAGPRKDWRRPAAVAIGTTALATLLSYALPIDYAATGVGLTFLGSAAFFALRGDDPEAARRYGISLGGLLDPEPLSLTRLIRDAARALGWALLAALIFLPPFWLGYVFWWSPERPFSPELPQGLPSEVLGQVLVIALPEEAFYRGYLQTAFDEARPPRWRVLKAPVGVGLFAASVLFAIGHVLTEVHPNRLAVFFPALLFGWLRARTGSIGASIAFHAICNVFASTLARSYGLAG